MFQVKTLHCSFVWQRSWHAAADLTCNGAFSQTCPVHERQCACVPVCLCAWMRARMHACVLFACVRTCVQTCINPLGRAEDVHLIVDRDFKAPSKVALVVPSVYACQLPPSFWSPGVERSALVLAMLCGVTFRSYRHGRCLREYLSQ